MPKLFLKNLEELNEDKMLLRKVRNAKPYVRIIRT